MKILEIRNFADKSEFPQAWLFYDPSSETFFAEIISDADPWLLPASLFGWAMQKKYTLGRKDTLRFIQERIIPAERQNISTILKDHGLKEYREWDMLKLYNGRCEQDDYELIPVHAEDLPEEIQSRISHHLRDFVIMENRDVLFFFNDGSTKSCDMTPLLSENRFFKPALVNDDFFQRMELLPSGMGIHFGTDAEILYDQLYACSQEIPVKYEIFLRFTKDRTVFTSEAAETTGCTRQNISALTKTGKLSPVKAGKKNMLFLKADLK